MNLDTVMDSRVLTGVTLGFHIIFATVGVGMPVMVLLAEWTGIRKNDPHYLLLARRWARGMSITVAVGVVTGTIIGLQLSLLWPSFMRVAGQIIALPLFMETFAFFFEAIFFGIYLYTWDRFSKRIYHWLLAIPIALGSTASAFFITTVNAFMNTPQGFRMENGKMTDIKPLVAMFNPATPTEVGHVVASAYATSAFVLASIAAWSLLRRKGHEYHHKALRLTMIWGFVFAVATAMIGDMAGKFLADYQPEKLAAAEWHFKTEQRANLLLGGILDEGTNSVRDALQIPGGLSFLAHNRFNSVVVGLEEFPRNLWPPLFIHYLFDLMAMIGTYLVVVPALYLLKRFRKKQNPQNRWLLWLVFVSGPLSVAAIEFGWIFSEIGRQPWILRGYMLTLEGATRTPYVGKLLVFFSLFYLVLGIASSYVLIHMFRKNTPEAEMQKRGIQ